MLKLWIPAFFIFSAGVCNAQTKIENTIRALEKKAVTGILTSDTNSLKEVWSPGFMVNTPRNTIAATRDDVFKNQKAGLIDYRSFDRIIEKIQVLQDVVITMGYETYIPNRDLPEAKAGEVVKRRFTNVWMKQRGKWLQVARHASIICS